MLIKKMTVLLLEVCVIYVLKESSAFSISVHVISSTAAMMVLQSQRVSLYTATTCLLLLPLFYSPSTSINEQHSPLRTWAVFWQSRPHGWWQEWWFWWTRWKPPGPPCPRLTWAPPETGQSCLATWGNKRGWQIREQTERKLHVNIWSA